MDNNRATGFGSNGLFRGFSKAIKDIASLGRKYDDLVVRQSMAVGRLEADYIQDSSLSQELAYAIQMQDIGDKKYIAYYDKDYRTRRDFLRKFALHGEIEFMVETIANEMIVYDDKNFFAYPDITGISSGLNLRDDKKEEILDTIERNFKWVYHSMGFNDTTLGWQYAWQFLVEGTIAIEIIYDEKFKKIIGFKELDATSLKPTIEKIDGKMKKVWVQYEDIPQQRRMLLDSQIIYISYAKGPDAARVSYCERLVRSFNLLRLMENTRLIWNLMNSTYRMKMIVPIGNKVQQKAQETLNSLMSMYKEDIYLDYDSGELTVNGKPSMQFYKNYMFPSKNGEHPDIETIAGDGPDLNSVESLQYFWDKLKMDSGIPPSRFDHTSGGGSWFGVAESYTVDEVRFGKFISRLRSSFQEILWKPLWISVCLDYPDLETDDNLRTNLGIRFNKDNIFEKLKEMEFMQKKVDAIQAMSAITTDDGSTAFFNKEFLIEKYGLFTREELKDNQEYIKKYRKGDAVAPEGGETPSETPTETPAEPPAETPAETPEETPTETPTETPSETPAEPGT